MLRQRCDMMRIGSDGSARQALSGQQQVNQLRSALAVHRGVAAKEE
jgi:hypothetical protein